MSMNENFALLNDLITIEELEQKIAPSASAVVTEP
jgi:hypothetical protein